MKSIVSVCAVSLSLIACAGSHGGARGPGNTENEWIALKSAHFTLKTDLDASEAMKVSAKLEEAYEAIATLGFESNAPPSIGIDVIYFRSQKSFAEVAPVGAAGYFVRNGRYDFERRPFAVLGGDFVDETRQILQHELTHMFVSYYYPQVPVWLNEGFAVYLETISVEDGTATVGRAPRRQRFWRGAWGHDSKTGTLNMPMGQAPTVAGLRTMPPATFYGSWNANRYDNVDASHATWIHYQAAWCLVHMLIENPKYGPLFTEYLARVHGGEREGSAWTKTLGTLDSDALEADYKVALIPNEVTLQRSKYSPTPFAAVPVSSMTPASVHVLMARLRNWNSDAGRQAAEADLAEARRDSETSEVAEIDAQWALEQKNYDGAEKLLRAALARHDSDPSLWSALGWVLLEEPRAGTIEDRKAALAPIAAKLAPIAKSSAELDLLGRERLLFGRPDEALAYEKRALAADSNCVDCLATTAAALFEKGLPNEALDVANLGLGLANEGARPVRLMAFAERVRKAIDEKHGGGGEAAPTAKMPPCTPYAEHVTQADEQPPIAADEKLVKPTLLCAPVITYSKEAFRNKVNGLALGKCIVEIDGTLSHCRVIRGLPDMDEKLLETFRSLRYSPAIYDGHPQRVEMTIPLRVPKP